MILFRSAIVALAFVVFQAMAEEAGPPKPLAFAFTEAQVKVIAETAIAKRDAAAAEWQRWNDILADIQKQATPKPETKEPPKAP